MLCKRQMMFLFFVLLTVAVATPIAQAQVRPVGLSDSQEPGSVLVFPLFVKGTVTTADQGVLPSTAFEISVVCPKGAICRDGQDVDIHFDWTCPGFDGTPFIGCQERNFTLNTTVNGTIRFDANGNPCVPQAVLGGDPEGCGGPVATPPCPRGFLTAWVQDEFGTPIKFDGLIGDAVLRLSATAVTAYNAIPIQAGAALATGASTSDHSGALEFDGTHYQLLTGKVIGSVRYDSPITAAGFQSTELVLLTLDTLSNRNNFPTNVDLVFYNETEQPSSQSTQFVCWGTTGSFSSAFGLTSSFCSSPADPGCKGLVQSGTVVKTPVPGIADISGPVTLLGLVVTSEVDGAGGLLRQYAYPIFNDSTTVDTDFVP